VVIASISGRGRSGGTGAQPAIWITPAIRSASDSPKPSFAERSSWVRILPSRKANFAAPARPPFCGVHQRPDRPPPGRIRLARICGTFSEGFGQRTTNNRERVSWHIRPRLLRDLLSASNPNRSATACTPARQTDRGRPAPAHDKAPQRSSLPFDRACGRAASSRRAQSRAVRGGGFEGLWADRERTRHQEN